MIRLRGKQSGFTIVELLIVIVVIAILATISVVAYNGIQERARKSAATSAALQAAKKAQAYHVANGAYPSSLSQISISNTDSITYDTHIVPNGLGFCVSASTGGVIYSAQAGQLPVEGDCGQVLVSYFNNMDLSGSPSYETSVNVIDFNWGSNSPKPGIVADNFSAKWTGFIIPPATGTYTFYSYVDDNVRLYVNNSLVIDKWTESWGEKLGTISLNANQPVSFVMETRDTGGGARAVLSWSYGAQAKVVIPADSYSRTGY